MLLKIFFQLESICLFVAFMPKCISVYVCKKNFQNSLNRLGFESISIRIPKILALFFLANSNQTSEKPLANL